jgi:hypothetical protein
LISQVELSDELLKYLKQHDEQINQCGILIEQMNNTIVSRFEELNQTIEDLSDQAELRAIQYVTEDIEALKKGLQQISEIQDTSESLNAIVELKREIEELTTTNSEFVKKQTRFNKSVKENFEQRITTEKVFQETVNDFNTTWQNDRKQIYDDLGKYANAIQKLGNKEKTLAEQITGLKTELEGVKCACSAHQEYLKTSDLVTKERQLTSLISDVRTEAQQQLDTLSDLFKELRSDFSELESVTSNLNKFKQSVNQALNDLKDNVDQKVTPDELTRGQRTLQQQIFARAVTPDQMAQSLENMKITIWNESNQKMDTLREQVGNFAEDSDTLAKMVQSLKNETGQQMLKFRNDVTEGLTEKLQELTTQFNKVIASVRNETGSLATLMYEKQEEMKALTMENHETALTPTTEPKLEQMALAVSTLGQTAEFLARKEQIKHELCTIVPEQTADYSLMFIQQFSNWDEIFKQGLHVILGFTLTVDFAFILIRHSPLNIQLEGSTWLQRLMLKQPLPIEIDNIVKLMEYTTGSFGIDPLETFIPLAQEIINNPHLYQFIAPMIDMIFITYGSDESILMEKLRTFPSQIEWFLAITKGANAYNAITERNFSRDFDNGIIAQLGQLIMGDNPMQWWIELGHVYEQMGGGHSNDVLMPIIQKLGAFQNYVTTRSSGP